MLKPRYNSKISLFKIFFIVLTLTFQNGIAQVGIGLPSGQDPEATLDVGFDNAVAPGFLMPRVNKFPTPATGETITEGLLVFLSADYEDENGVNHPSSYYVFIDGEWKSLAETAGIILPGGGGGNGVVTIHEGYFENGNDGWLDFNDSNRAQSGYSCEQDYSMEIWNSNGGSKIELNDQDLSSFNAVSIEFEYRTNSDWESEDYFTLQFNNQELGRWYSSDQNCSSVIVLMDSDNYSFGSADDFKFEGEMSWDGESVFIDAVIIKGYTSSGITVCETSFENDYGCWVNGNNTSRVRSNANTGRYSVQFDGNNGNDSYIQTENSIDASSYSVGLISLYYDGNNEVESDGQYGDYLIIQYYDTGSSSWRVLPGAAFGVNQSYTQLDYTIPSQYLTATLQLRIVFDATASDEFMYLDDTEILFFD